MEIGKNYSRTEAIKPNDTNRSIMMIADIRKIISEEPSSRTINILCL